MNRKDLVKKNFPECANAALAINDPSGKNKYLLWIAKQLKSGHNESDISATIKFFHENLDRFEEKDIYKYKDLKDLENFIKDIGLSNRKIKESDKDTGSSKIFESDDFICVRIDSKPAMMLYGAGTKWCTTMEDQTYYEDYVSNGNDFYVIIVKNKRMGSSKYAIVKRGLFELKCFDAEDELARDFKDDEEDGFRPVVQAIVADKPPRNYLRDVCKGLVPASDAIEWLKTQSPSTQEFVEDCRFDIKFLSNSVEDIIKSLISKPWELRGINLSNVSYDKVLEIAKVISKENSSKFRCLKTHIIEILKREDLNIFEKDKSVEVRAKLASINPLNFINDRSRLVIKSVARNLKIDQLLEGIESTKNRQKKDIFKNLLFERISNLPKNKLYNFILNQPNDVLVKLFESEIS